MSVRLCACFSAAPTRQSTVKFDSGDCNEKIFDAIQILLQSGKNFGHCTWRPKYVLLLLSSSAVVSGCSDSRGDANNTLMWHSVRLYVHCLLFIDAYDDEKLIYWISVTGIWLMRSSCIEQMTVSLRPSYVSSALTLPTVYYYPLRIRSCKQSLAVATPVHLVLSQFLNRIYQIFPWNTAHVLTLVPLKYRWELRR